MEELAVNESKLPVESRIHELSRDRRKWWPSVLMSDRRVVMGKVPDEEREKAELASLPRESRECSVVPDPWEMADVAEAQRMNL